MVVFERAYNYYQLFYIVDQKGGVSFHSHEEECSV